MTPEQILGNGPIVCLIPRLAFCRCKRKEPHFRFPLLEIRIGLPWIGRRPSSPFISLDVLGDEYIEDSFANAGA